MICAAGESDETGVIMPANCDAGSTVMMAVPTMGNTRYLPVCDTI